ncbi:MAG: hypothetical protein HFE63_03800 [Clostridiales bacterium]|nr:hypothetical protein [Clostridiales bacterium]
MSQNEITAKVAQIKELMQLIEEATTEADTLKDEIKEYMTAKSVDELTAGLFKVRYKIVKSSRFDSAAFKKESPELYERYAKQTESRRFSIA